MQPSTAVQHKIAHPALRGMDRGQDQIVLIGAARRLIASRIRWVERQPVGSSRTVTGPFAPVARDQRRTEASSWMRSRCGRTARATRSAGHRPASGWFGARRRRPSSIARSRRCCDLGRAPRGGSGLSAIASITRCADVGPTPEAASGENQRAIARVLYEAQQRQHAPTCAPSGTRPPNFTNGMLRRVSSTGGRCGAGAKQHGSPLERPAPPRLPNFRMR